MFGLAPWHLVAIIVAALLIFGPDRLPSLAKDAGKVLRQLRRMASDVREDLKEELGPEIGGLDLKSMHPKALIHKHLLDPALDDEDETTVSPRAVGAMSSSGAPVAAVPASASVAAAPVSAAPVSAGSVSATPVSAGPVGAAPVGAAQPMGAVTVPAAVSAPYDYDAT